MSERQRKRPRADELEAARERMLAKLEAIFSADVASEFLGLLVKSIDDDAWWHDGYETGHRSALEWAEEIGIDRVKRYLDEEDRIERQRKEDAEKAERAEKKKALGLEPLKPHELLDESYDGSIVSSEEP